MALTREEELELERYPDQSITWAYEEEIPATQVLLDIPAGCRTNQMINVFHLPESKLGEWKEKTLVIVKDAALTALGRPTSVGFEVGQQHIADYLQQNCSQQHILMLAANKVYADSIKSAEAIKQRAVGNGFFDFLSEIMKPDGGHSPQQ